MWIKILLIIAVVAVTVALTRATGDARHQALRRILLAAFVLAAAVAVVWPPLLTRLANLVGVGRGSDLLLYALVIAFLSYISTSFRRLRRLSDDLTTLARQVTLLRAQVEDQQAVHGPPPADTPGADLHKSSTESTHGLPRDSTASPYDSERD